MRRKPMESGPRLGGPAPGNCKHSREAGSGCRRAWPISCRRRKPSAFRHRAGNTPCFRPAARRAGRRIRSPAGCLSPPSNRPESSAVPAPGRPGADDRRAEAAIAKTVADKDILHLNLAAEIWCGIELPEAGHRRHRPIAFGQQDLAARERGDHIPVDMGGDEFPRRRIVAFIVDLGLMEELVEDQPVIGRCKSEADCAATHDYLTAAGSRRCPRPRA